MIRKEDRPFDRYMEYLDKEMTIMGILSAFCLAVPSLVLEKLATARENDLARVWAGGRDYFLVGSGLLLVSAALFYKQRSLLARYYGLISLAPDSGEVSDSEDVGELVQRSWKWTTWVPYQLAFWTGVTAALNYVLGVSLSGLCT